MTKQIRRIRRIAYNFRGDVDLSGAAAEITFNDGTVDLYDAGGDGEVLKIEPTGWEDPFAEPLDEANRRWVAEYGKHVAVDVSAISPYNALIGKTVERFEDVANDSGKTVGRRFYVGDRILELLTGADDLQVSVIPSDDA